MSARFSKAIPLARAARTMLQSGTSRVALRCAMTAGGLSLYTVKMTHCDSAKLTPAQAAIDDAAVKDEQKIVIASALEPQTAGFAIRVGAKMIDCVINNIISFASQFVLSRMGISLSFYACLDLVYGMVAAYLSYSDGQTPGKHLMGLKVVRKDGSKADAADYLKRNAGEIAMTSILTANQVAPGLLWLPAGASVLGHLIDDLYCLFDKDGQCLHDQWSQTMVVVDN